MNDLINKTQYGLHKRKLSQIKESRAKFMQPISRPPNLKGKYLKKINKVRQMTIENDNYMLLEKFRELENKKQKAKTQGRQLISLNFNQRLNFFEKVHNQNIGIMKRLSSQKTEYPVKQYQKKYKRMSLNNVMRSRTRTENSLIKQQKNSDTDYEILPILTDDFTERIIIYSKIESILNQLCRVQISQSQKFYYVLLEFLNSRRNYKLRLLPDTGKKLFLLAIQSQNYFQKKVTINKKNNLQLVIPFLPFMRRYAFSELKKTIRQSNQSQCEDSENLKFFLKQFDDESINLDQFGCSNKSSQKKLTKRIQEQNQQDKYINYDNQEQQNQYSEEEFEQMTSMAKLKQCQY